MNISCEIIKDLLPLYSDDVCSPASRTVIEAHIKECSRCEEFHKSMLEELSYAEQELNESEPIKVISKAWKKDKSKSFTRGMLFSILFCAIAVSAFLVLTQWKIIPVSAELLEISEITKLFDGRISYHLYVNDDRNLNYMKFSALEDGSYYITPVRSIIEKRRPADEQGLWNNYFILDTGENNGYEKQYEDISESKSFYIGPVGNGKLIWESGMDIPMASPEIEEIIDMASRLHMGVEEMLDIVSGWQVLTGTFTTYADPPFKSIIILQDPEN